MNRNLTRPPPLVAQIAPDSWALSGAATVCSEVLPRWDPKQNCNVCIECCVLNLDLPKTQNPLTNLLRKQSFFVSEMGTPHQSSQTPNHATIQTHNNNNNNYYYYYYYYYYHYYY